MIPATEIARPIHALPFWLSLALVPIAWIAVTQGGWAILLMPAASWLMFSALDALTGETTENADPATEESQLFWYRLVTLIWAPVQFAVIFGTIWYATRADHLAWWELVGIGFGVGILSGTVGINYSHELMHQRNRAERWLADLLLAMVLYSHFRTEHLLVHHRYVGTPRDTVTARYNEGFHRFFPRVLWEGLGSAFRAEKAMLGRKGLAWWHRSNPFWRYALLQALFLALAIAIGGWVGLAMFVYQAFIAVWQLELVNYVEHYGLTRKHLGGGKYEHVQPRHSWNSARTASNWLLINLQRHSDHHFKPDRRFPLLQTYGDDQAPNLPYGYPVMTVMAMIPPVWRRYMNPKVRAWRRKFYPEIEDWQPYNQAATPLPR